MAAKAQDSGSELMRLANAPALGAQRSPFLEEPTQGNDSGADLMRLSAEPAQSPISRMTRGVESVAKNIDRAATQFSEGFFIRKPGQIKSAQKVGRAQGSFLEGEKRSLALSFPGISGAAPPSFDEMENVAAEDGEFAQVWGGLKTELMASEDRAAVIKPEEYEQNKMLVAYEQYREAQDGLSEMNRGLSFEDFSERAGRIGVQASPAMSPGVTFGQDAPEAPMPHDELNRFFETDIPGFTRPPLTKEEISAAAYEFMRGGAEEDLNKLPLVVRKVVAGLAAGTRMAVEIVPIGKAARALGAVGKAAAPFLEGAGQSAMDQGLAIESGAQTEPFSVGDVAAQAVLMKAGSVAGKALAKKVPGGPKSSPMVSKVAGMTGMVGTIEAGNAALNYAKTGKAPLEGSEDIGKDILGTIIEGGVAILTASKLGGGKSAELSAGELAKAKSQRAIIDRATYLASRKTGMSIEDSVRKALPKVFAEKDRVLKENELKIQDKFLQRQVRVLELGRDFDEYLDKHAGKDLGDRKELTFDLRRALEDANQPQVSRLAKGAAFAEGVAKLKALGGQDGGLAAGRAQMEQGIIPEAVYQHRLPQTGDPALRKQSERALLQSASKGGTESPSDGFYDRSEETSRRSQSAKQTDEMLEIGRRIVESENPSAYSAEILKLAEAIGDSRFVEEVQSVVDRSMPRSGKNVTAEKIPDIEILKAANKPGQDALLNLKQLEQRIIDSKDPEQYAASLMKMAESVGDHIFVQEVYGTVDRAISMAGNKPRSGRYDNRTDQEMIEAAAKSSEEAGLQGSSGELLQGPKPSREILEIERRVVESNDPTAYADELLRTAESIGDAALVEQVQGAIDRGLPRSGKGPSPEKVDDREATVIYKHEFDQGHLDAKPGRSPLKVSREAASSGSYGELVGGYKFNEKRGHYLPLVVLGPSADVPVEPGERGPRQPQQTKAPLASAQVRGHAMRRTTKSFEDAIAKHNLDITHTKAIDLFLDQFEASKRMMSLEIGRESGHVLKPDELPNAEALEAAKLEIVERANRIKELQSGFGKMSVAEKAQARDQILADNIAIKKLRKLVKGEFFKEAKSRDSKAPEWGVYEGYYIHPELHARFLDAPGPRSSGQYIRDAIVNKLKFARVGGSIKQWLPDIVGNAIKWSTGGVSSWRQFGKTAKVELGGARHDRVDMMFDVLSRNAELGGPADLTTQESQRTAKIDSEIAQAERQGRSGDVKKLGIARAIETSGDLVMGAIETRLGMLGKGITSPGRFAQKLGRARIKSDRASSRAAFRELMENGIDGSGPLSASEAFEIVKKVDDYGTLHKGIQEAAKWMHFLRFPSKVAQATMAQMEKRPSIFGQAIPTPMDTVIRRQPGSGPAKAALVTRGIMRLATSVAQVAWIPMAAQKTMMEELGISQKKLDEYIDETYGWMPPQARFLTKLMFVPTGKTKLGGVEGFDASSYMPQAQMLRFFWMNFSKDGGDWQTQLAQEVISKNLLAAPIAQGMTGKRFTGSPASEGAGPGDRWYPAMTMLAPAFMVDSLNEWFQQNNVPESERSAMRGVLKSVVGVPMTVLRNKSFVRTMLDDYNERGIVEKVIGEDTGSWFYRVKNPETQSGMAAQQIIDYAEKAQPDLFSFQMKQARKIEQIKEAAGGGR